MGGSSAATHLLLRARPDGEQRHGAVGSTASGASSVGSLRGGEWLGTSSPRWWGEGLGRQLGPKCGGQVLLHLLPARLLQVVARRVLQMGLHLWNAGETGWEGTR